MLASRTILGTDRKTGLLQLLLVKLYRSLDLGIIGLRLGNI